MARNRLVWLFAGCVLSAALYMTLDARAPWSFLLPFRGAKLMGVVLVAVSISTATVLFQTLTQNRILTPSIMGFDALYLLLLTGTVFSFGSQSVLRLPPMVVFGVTALVLVGFALLLFDTLLNRVGSDLFQLVLTGLILGVFFRALTSFLQRMIDPNEFATIQAASFASFNDIQTDLLWVAGPLCGAALVAAWRMRHSLDVIALGPEIAVSLGETPGARQWQVLCVIAVLVAVSTALVGPIAFLGLLVVSLAHLAVPSPYHAYLLPAAACVSGIVLIGGQTLLERVLGFATPLSVVVDLVGGAVFLFLVLRRRTR